MPLFDILSGMFLGEIGLTSAQGKVGKGPRYAVYDFNYDLASGEGSRFVVTMQINWTQLILE